MVGESGGGSREEVLEFKFLEISFFSQGAAAGIIETTVLYAMSVVFSDQLGEVSLIESFIESFGDTDFPEQMVAYQETAIGLALMVGPLLGGGLFAAVGFFYTFVGNFFFPIPEFFAWLNRCQHYSDLCNSILCSCGDWYSLPKSLGSG